MKNAVVLILIIVLPKMGKTQTLKDSIEKSLHSVQRNYVVESDERVIKQLEEDYPKLQDRERFINEFASNHGLSNLSRAEKLKAAGIYNFNHSPKASCRAFENIKATTKNPEKFESVMSASGAAGPVAFTASKILFRERAAIEAARITSAIVTAIEKAGFRDEFIHYHGHYGVEDDMARNWNDYMRKPLENLRKTLPKELESMGINPTAAKEISGKMASMSGSEAQALLGDVYKAKGLAEGAINVTSMTTDRSIALFKTSEKDGVELIGGKAYEVSDEFANRWAKNALKAAVESDGKLAQEIVRASLLSAVEKTTMEEGSRRAARAAAGRFALKIIVNGAGKWILEGAIPMIGWAMIGSDIAHAAAPEVTNSDLHFKEQSDVSMFFSGEWDQSRFCNEPISEEARAQVIAVSRAIESGVYERKTGKNPVTATQR